MKPAVLALTLLGLAVPAAEAAEQSAPAPKDCFQTQFVGNRFARTGTYGVNVAVNNKDVYHVEWRGPCGGIDWFNAPATLRARTGGSRVCTTDSIDVVVAAPLGLRYCRVVSIRKLSKAEYDALPHEQRP